MHDETEKYLNISVGRPEGNRPLRRPRHIGNIKLNVF
jgi:hypothetical protein